MGSKVTNEPQGFKREGIFLMHKFEKMTQEQAEEIAHKWHYDGEYAFPIWKLMKKT